MKSMKISTEEKKDMTELSAVSDREKYPYGLKLHFDEKAYPKLELRETPKVGDKFMIIAYAEVCDVHQSRYEGDVPEINMGLQIMDIDLKKKDDERQERDIATELYG